MQKLGLVISTLAFFTACAWVPPSKNPNIKKSPERIAWEACKTANNGDVSKCQKEKNDLLERQEMELLDEDT
ncbi:MAG: hypothetical protein ACK443_00685 [Methylococcaceae bacterium]